MGSSTGVSIFTSCFSIALVGTTILGYVCSRVIGSVYIHKEDPSKVCSFCTFNCLLQKIFVYFQVRIATVGFLGRRKDTIFDIQDIKLLSETSENPNRPIWRIHFHNDKLSNLLISTKFGGIQDPETFRLVFGKIIVE